MYWIVSDSSIDMPKAWIDAQPNFRIKSLSYLIDGQPHIPDGTDEETRRIYAQLRAGVKITTSQVNSEEWSACFRELLAQGQDILAVLFSGGLSGTCAAAETAAKELRQEFPERKLVVIDSLCASAGEGLLVYYALRNRQNGMSLEDNAAWVRNNVQNLIHWFTVDDLMFLYRGGRVSATSAYIGSLARIKPVMHVDPEGHLALKEKVAGRKRSIRRLADKVKENIVAPEGQVIFISHGDCVAEAQSLADILRSELPMIADVQISFVGPVIGAHSGPGTIAVFFLGNGRVHLPQEKN